MARPRTRLDKVVELRERHEEAALMLFAEARSCSGRARDRLASAVAATRVDARSLGPVELWQADELARRRALQAVRSAEGELAKAVADEGVALDGYTVARQSRRAVGRAQEKKQGEILGELDRKERLGQDELATMRFNSRAASSAQ